MLIFDAHLDLSWNALGWNRDLDQTVAEIRLSESGMDGKARGKNTVSLPDMRRGKIGIALATLLARCESQRALFAGLSHAGDCLRYRPGTAGLLSAAGTAG